MFLFGTKQSVAVSHRELCNRVKKKKPNRLVSKPINDKITGSSVLAFEQTKTNNRIQYARTVLKHVTKVRPQRSNQAII